MKKKKNSKLGRVFDRFSTKVTQVTGKPVSFIIAIVIVVVWAVTGPIFDYSDTWQLVINTGTTIITFLMVFVIQQSQNKDTAAIHLKLNELIAASETASNRLVSAEDLTEEELLTLKEFYVTISELAKKDIDLFSTHSVDEAKVNHVEKSSAKRRDKMSAIDKTKN